MFEFSQSRSEWNEQRSFCDHELAAVFDNYGGLCELNIIDCHTEQGYLLPDEWPLPILSRARGTSVGHPLYGPAVHFYTKDNVGRDVPHFPAGEQHFSPWSLHGGDAEQTYAMLMDRNRVLWQCTAAMPGRREFCMAVSKTHWMNGKANTHKNQHWGLGSTQIGDHYEEAGIPLTMPLPEMNGTVTAAWSEDGYDEKQGVLYFRGVMQYPYGEKVYVMALGLNRETVRRDTHDLTLLCATWNEATAITAGLALGATREEALASLQDGLQRFDEIRAEKIRRGNTLQQQADRVCAEKLPKAGEFGTMAATYLDSLRVGKTDDGYIGFRAAVQKFGYFSLWDTIFPIRDALWNGHTDDAIRMLHYLFRLPAIENTPLSALQCILEWNEALAFCPAGSLDDLYPAAVRIFRFAARLTEPQYGLLALKCNTGVDKPPQVGLSGMFVSPEVNTFWYSVCRILRNQALLRGDTAVVEEATASLKNLEEGFRRFFFVEDVGYLRIAANRDGTPTSCSIYHNSVTLGADYPFGLYFLRDYIPALAAYQAGALWHPMGHKAVCFDSGIPCNMWKSIHMNQHNGHEMKLQRLADHMPEVYRVMGQYLTEYDRWKNAQEVFNFALFGVAAGQCTDWQTFSATANMEALRAAVAGISIHLGGLCYTPAHDDGTVTVENVPYGNTVLTVHVSGSGASAVLSLDGNLLPGTLQLPSDIVCRTGSVLEIRRTDIIPAYPVLEQALDLPVRELGIEGTALSFTCERTAHSPIRVAGKIGMTATVNGTSLPLTVGQDGKVWVDVLLHAGDRVRFVNPQ